MLKQFSFAYKGESYFSIITSHICASADLRFIRKTLLVLGFTLVSLFISGRVFAVSSYAAINQTINVQSKIVKLSDGTNLTVGTPACVKSGADTCDFRIRIWNHITNSSTTSGTGNLLFTQTFQDVEIGNNNGIFNLSLNSCGSSASGNSQWGTSVGTCTVTDDSDADSDPGVSFNRTDLYIEVSFAPSDTAGSLGSFTEVFTRIPISSFTNAFYSQDAASLGGVLAGSFVQISPSAAQGTGDITNPMLYLSENGTGTPNIMDLQVGGTTKFLISNTGQLGIGTGTLGSTWLTLAAPTSTSAQINFISTAAADPSAPTQGDLWYNGTNLNFYDGSRTVDLIPSNAQGFVKLQPTAVQAAGGSTSLIWLNSTTGTPNLIDLQKSTVSKMLVNNAGQLQLSTQGNTGGLLFGGDTTLYRSASNTLKTDNSFMVGDALSDTFTNWGVSDFTGNIRSVVTVANGSTTASAAGTSSTKLAVASTTNFDPGNLVLINGTTYAYIESIDSATQMTISPATTWANGNTVVEYTVPSFQFQKAYFLGGIVTGGGSGTAYSNKQISTSGGMTISNTGTNGVLGLNSQGYINISTSGGLTLTKNESTNATGVWSTGTGGGTIRYLPTGVQYNGKWYIWSGCKNISLVFCNSSVLNTLQIYDFATRTWSTGAAGGTARRGATAVVYNDKMYAWGGLNSAGARLNTLDIYDFSTNSWSTGTAGGTARAGHVATVYNSKMYIWGGDNGNTIYIYDFATDSWSTGSTGGTIRQYPLGVVYNDKWYIWGGGNFQNILEIYDFKTDTWSTGVSGGTARNSATAVVYQNKMYAWGGFGSGSTLNTIDVYDFATSTWTTGTAGGTARGSSTSTLYGGKWYIFGGANSTSTVVYDVLETFDFNNESTVFQVNVAGQEKLRLDTNNVLTVTGNQGLSVNYYANDLKQYTTQGWSTGTAGGTSRTAFVPILYNGKIYFWGGSNGVNALNTMDIYDINLGTWSTGATGGTARHSYAAGLYNGKIYFAQGCTNAACSTVTNTVDIYDIAGNSWSTGTAGGTARGQVGAVLYNGKLYITNGQIAAGTRQTAVDIYNISANSWSTGTAGGTGRDNPSIAAYGTKLYVWGGLTATPALLNTLDIYDIYTATWTTGTAGGTARAASAAIVYNGKIYNFGGCTNTGCTTTTNSVDIYDIEKNAWITGSSAGGTARGAHNGLLYFGKFYDWGGTTGAALLNTVDIYDFGVSKYDDVFYIANGQTNGADEGKLFRFDASGRAYTSKQGGWFSTGADYAEYMYTQDTSLSGGELVCLDDSGSATIRRSLSARDSQVIGVVSTEPGFVGNIQDINDYRNNNGNWKLLSMTGQVPVKVNDENGPIKIGDYITSSSTPGIGMKANAGDPTIGTAEQNYTGSKGEIKSIQVLITRNNQVLNSAVELQLGDNNQAGFRVNSEGKIEYREAGSTDWKLLSERMTQDKSMLWKQTGDAVYAQVLGSANIGLKPGEEGSSKLNVAGSFEARSGSSFIKLSSEGLVTIGGYNLPIGIRVNPASKELEFQDAKAGDWQSLDELLIATTRVEIDKVIQTKGQFQIIGWGYVKGDPDLDKISRVIQLGRSYQSLPIAVVTGIGSSSEVPSDPSKCNLPASDVNFSIHSDQDKVTVGINADSDKLSDTYYCFSWMTVGK
jgi:N-acetylneuraminic acid mutarotase